jgi:hypothetical protein
MGSSELQIQTDSGLISMPNNVCCVVVEYLPGGALKSFLIKNRRRKLAFKVVIQLALDMARGYSYFYSEFFPPCNSDLVLVENKDRLVICFNRSNRIHLDMQTELSSLSEDCPQRCKDREHAVG